MNEHEETGLPLDSEPPTDLSGAEEASWQRWQQHRREPVVGSGFTERVMAAVTTDRVELPPPAPQLVTQLGDSPWTRLTVCSAAMLVGILPFLYLAVAAKIIPF